MLKSIVTKPVFKKALVCFCLWIMGFVIAFSLFGHTHLTNTPHPFNLQQSYGLFDFKTIKLFFKIFLTNTLVALLLSVGGYFTGGLLTIFVSVWNGVKLGIVVGVAMIHLSLIQILISLIHGPFEIAAFLWFGGFGLLGFFNIKRLMAKQKITLANFPSRKEFIPPLLLLFTAAIIETSLFVFYS